MWAFCAVMACTMALPPRAFAQFRAPDAIPPHAAESDLILEMRQLRDETSPRRNARFHRIVQLADALLERYPHSEFKTDALILKLTVFSGLSRTDSKYIKKLQDLTESIAKDLAALAESGTSPASGDKLASENAYYAIDAFVMAARRDEMPDKARLAALEKRYEAFGKQHTESRRAPSLGASLVRNLIEQGKLEAAHKQVERLEAQYPGNAGNRRARGELRRANSIGKPFAIDYQTASGGALRTADFKGKVVLLHFWARPRTPEADFAPKLKALHQEFHSRGLQIISVSVDRDREASETFAKAAKVPWVQHYDPKGFVSDLIVDNGVTRLPSCFVIDRAGVLRSAEPGDELAEVVKKLMTEPATEAGGAAPAPKSPSTP